MGALIAFLLKRRAMLTPQALSLLLLLLLFACIFVVPASSMTYILSLHDALPIYLSRRLSVGAQGPRRRRARHRRDRLVRRRRSEEHTSELQSLRQLVCRLLLEKKKPISRRAPREPSSA